MFKWHHDSLGYHTLTCFQRKKSTKSKRSGMCSDVSQTDNEEVQLDFEILLTWTSAETKNTIQRFNIFAHLSYREKTTRRWKIKQETVWVRQWWRGKIFCRVHFIGAVFAITTISRNIISNFQVTGDGRQVENNTDVAKDVSHDINVTQLIMIQVFQILSTNVLIII